jgi:hypothetical protein
MTGFYLNRPWPKDLQECIETTVANHKGRRIAVHGILFMSDGDVDVNTDEGHFVAEGTLREEIIAVAVAFGVLTVEDGE